MFPDIESSLIEWPDEFGICRSCSMPKGWQNVFVAIVANKEHIYNLWIAGFNPDLSQNRLV